MKYLNIKNMLFATSMLAAGYAGVTSAHAAIAQGVTGPTSNGTFDVNLEIQNKLRISDLALVDMGIFGGADMTGDIDACAFFNQGNTANYRLTLDSGNNPGGPFTLAVGGNNIVYTVQLSANGAPAVPATAATPVTALSVGPNFATDNDCATGTTNNLNIQTDALAADIVAAGANGVYIDEVSILMEPDF